MCIEYHILVNMYHVSAQGVDERKINVHYDYYYYGLGSQRTAECAPWFGDSQRSAHHGSGTVSGVRAMVRGQSAECAPWFRDSQRSVHHGSGTVSGVCTMVQGQSAECAPWFRDSQRTAECAPWFRECK